MKSALFATGILLSVCLVVLSIHSELQASGSWSRPGHEVSAIEFPTLGTRAEGQAVLFQCEGSKFGLLKTGADLLAQGGSETNALRPEFRVCIKVDHLGTVARNLKIVLRLA